MPDSKITALASIGTGTDPANDPLVIVDVSDVAPGGMSATGTTKRVTLNQLLACSPTATLASATITGDLTVDTSTLKVDSANDRVGIGTATPVAGDKLTVAGGVTINNTTTPISEYFADVSAYADFGAALTVRSNSNPSVYRERIVSTRGQYADQMGWKITTQSGSGTEKESFSIAPSGNVSVYGSTTVNTTNYIGASTWAAQLIGASVGASSGLSLLSYSAGGQPTPASLHVAPIADYRSALVATFSADASGAGYFAVNQFSPASATTVERFRVDRDGNLNIANGNVVMGTSGKGIDFSATANGNGVMTSELLNDYEEGNWTVGLSDLFGNDATVSAQTGRYTKIGRRVFCFANITLSNKGAGAAGNLPYIVGLPFQAIRTEGSVVQFYANTSLTTNGQINFQTAAGNNVGNFTVASSTTGTTFLTFAQITNTTQFIFCVSYDV